MPKTPATAANRPIDAFQRLSIDTADGTGEVLATRIADKLRAAITRGEVTPGSRMRLEELRTTLGVSFSPLREALSRLDAEGFVVAENQRGYRVAPVSEQNLREITQIRLALEPMALRESIISGDGDWEGGVVAAFHQLTQHPSRRARPGACESSEFEKWERAHRAFHQSLLSGCRMPILFQFCLTLYDLSDRYRRLYLSRRPTPDRAVTGEHKRIAEAAIARDADAASRLLHGHIERVSARVLQSLSEQPPAGKSRPARRA